MLAICLLSLIGGIIFSWLVKYVLDSYYDVHRSQEGNATV